MSKLRQFKKDKKPIIQTRSVKKESGLSFKALSPPDIGIQFVTNVAKKAKKKTLSSPAGKKKETLKKSKKGHIARQLHQNLPGFIAVIKQDEHDEHLTILAAKHIKKIARQLDSSNAEHNAKILEDIVYWMHTNGLQHTCTYTFAKELKKEAHGTHEA